MGSSGFTSTLVNPHRSDSATNAPNPTDWVTTAARCGGLRNHPSTIPRGIIRSATGHLPTAGARSRSCLAGPGQPPRSHRSPDRATPDCLRSRGGPAHDVPRYSTPPACLGQCVLPRALRRTEHSGCADASRQVCTPASRCGATRHQVGRASGPSGAPPRSCGRRLFPGSAARGGGTPPPRWWTTATVGDGTDQRRSERHQGLA